jgi:hypothetical protein
MMGGGEETEAIGRGEKEEAEEKEYRTKRKSNRPRRLMLYLDTVQGAVADLSGEETLVDSLPALTTIEQDVWQIVRNSVGTVTCLFNVHDRRYSI